MSDLQDRPESCRHCGVTIDRGASGKWAHVVGPGSRLIRCQAPNVPYGREAEPVPDAR